MVDKNKNIVYNKENMEESRAKKMVYIPVKCPHCGSENIKKNGKMKSGKQRYLCCNEDCKKTAFILDYTYNAYNPEVREQIFFSIVNGNGTRATARLLNIAKDTVTDALRSMK